MAVYDNRISIDMIIFSVAVYEAGAHWTEPPRRMPRLRGASKRAWEVRKKMQKAREK